MSEVAVVLTHVDLKRRAGELLARLLAMVAMLAKSDFSVVVSHADRGTALDRRLVGEVAKFGNVDVVSTKTETAMVNLSRLRNLGAQRIKADAFLIVDVDIHPDIELLSALLSQVSSKRPLAMAPCLYLTSQGTKRLLSRKARSDEMIESALAFNDADYLHWAIPSSVMAIRSEAFRATGGFCEEYEGYGYEDLDFMLRVAIEHSMIASTESTLVDRTYIAPLLSTGFRAQLGVLCLANLMLGNVGLHLWHRKDADDPFILARKRNAVLFSDRLRRYCEEPLAPDPVVPVLVSAFYEACRRYRRSPEEFHALFDSRPRYMVRSRTVVDRIARHWNGVSAKWH